MVPTLIYSKFTRKVRKVFPRPEVLGRLYYCGFDVVSESHYGRTRYDAPEIDGKVYFTSPAGTRFAEGSFVDVKITEAMDYDLVGETKL